MQFGRHISGQFNVELESIRTQVLTMGGLVEQQLSFAMQALHKEDEALARKVVQDDDKVDEMDLSINEACTRIIAKRQPTAKDLRLIMAIVKTMTDLERVGDVATQIMKITVLADDRALHSSSQRTHTRYAFMLEGLFRQTITMLHRTLDAFARMDLEAAIDVHQLDDQIDTECHVVCDQLTLAMTEDTQQIPYLIQLMRSAQALERVGDRCQNLCEYLIYFVTGKDVRHMSPVELKMIVQKALSES